MSERTRPDDPPRREGAVRAALIGVAAAGAVLAGAGTVVGGARTLLGIAVGAALGVANLWVMSRVVAAFVAGGGRGLPWSLIALVKLIALFGGLWLLAKSGVVELGSLALGLGALPIGIVVSQLRARGESDAAGIEGRS
jgi:hypothetical protein